MAVDLPPPLFEAPPVLKFEEGILEYSRESGRKGLGSFVVNSL